MSLPTLGPQDVHLGNRHEICLRGFGGDPSRSTQALIQRLRRQELGPVLSLRSALPGCKGGPKPWENRGKTGKIAVEVGKIREKSGKNHEFMEKKIVVFGDTVVNVIGLEDIEKRILKH